MGYSSKYDPKPREYKWFMTVCNRPEISIKRPLPRSNVVYICLLPCRPYFPFWQVNISKTGMKGFVIEIYAIIYNLYPQFCPAYKMIFKFFVSFFISQKTLYSIFLCATFLFVSPQDILALYRLDLSIFQVQGEVFTTQSILNLLVGLKGRFISAKYAYTRTNFSYVEYNFSEANEGIMSEIC